MNEKRRLTDKEITALKSRGCSAENWNTIAVSGAFTPERMQNTHFAGRIEVGDISGAVQKNGEPSRPCGIFNAVVIDCTIGDDCRIANTGVHIAHYDIGSDVCIEDVGTMQTYPKAAFGNGIEVDVLNEGGGREVPLFNALSSQFAYMMCLHRHRPELITRLKEIAEQSAGEVQSGRGAVGDGAVIRSVATMIDVAVGPAAEIKGAAVLKNGTILSDPKAPTEVGAGVTAEDFIIAEGAAVTNGAILKHAFIGQACTIGNGFSAENCLFFANSEAFHGEGCSAFCGPYTVTHHKSTLLIAGLFSFYNAGSGTNQSNHMYKLGPVHEGKLERGTKTGSFSYMMWPCRTGPFSVVMGKHAGPFDTTDYPFSHIEADASGRASIIPGLNLTTVGTVRDGAKWPGRDKRTEALKRDRIIVDVFSPYLACKMIKAQRTLKELQKTTDKSVPEVSLNGALIRRPILRTAQKYYRTGIEMFLFEALFERAEKAVSPGGMESILQAFRNNENGIYSGQWVDIGGQLMPQKRLEELQDAIESGRITDASGFLNATKHIKGAYPADKWIWVKTTYRNRSGVDLDNAGKEDVVQIADSFLKVKGKFLRLVLADAEKEFDDQSSLGFGQDGGEGDIQKDFFEVRGNYEGNQFVRAMKKNLEELQKRVSDIKEKLQ